MAHVGAALQEVRRAAVAQRVRGDADVDAGGLGFVRTRSWMRLVLSRVPQVVMKSAPWRGSFTSSGRASLR